MHWPKQVAEQIPGLIAAGDLTRTLERGYWPSYNIPYFPEVHSGSLAPSAGHASCAET